MKSLKFKYLYICLPGGRGSDNPFKALQQQETIVHNAGATQSISLLAIVVPWRETRTSVWCFPHEGLLLPPRRLLRRLSLAVPRMPHARVLWRSAELLRRRPFLHRRLVVRLVPWICLPLRW